MPWSKTLTKQTRDMLEGKNTPYWNGEGLELKNLNGKFGTLDVDREDDRKTWIVHIKTFDDPPYAGETESYASVDAVLDAGWAVD
jgi:hypothetical protein